MRETNKTKRPAFQFYPSDWRTDTALQFCSLSARGLWIEMMCVAHECDPYGHLVVNGRPMTAAQIGRLVGISEKECSKLLAELLGAGVCSKTEEGAIYSRRMVRDEELRNKRAAGGNAGAEHGAKGGSHGVKGGRPEKKTDQKKTPLETPLSDETRGVIKPPYDPPLKPPPSSSSSSSSSENLSDADASDGEPSKITDPNEIIFGYGVPLLTAAGTAEKQARSFLGGLRKAHGDHALIDKLRECLRQKPLQPLEWLAAALPPPGSGSCKPSRHAGFENVDYRAGISADGRF